MNLPRRFRSAFFATGLILSGMGCELIAAPDRSTIPQGAGGSEPGSGGGGGTPGSGGAGGVGGAGGCMPTDDMNDCTVDACDADGKTVHTPVAEGTTCASNGGAKCKADGTCVVCIVDGDCTTPNVCDAMNACVAPTCMDMKLDGYETDVDCGGADCTKCDDGKMCVADADCVNAYCDAAKTCQTPTCADGVQNSDETDVDCGGGCAPADKCADGKGCAVADDCSSGVCKDDGSGALTCAAPVCGDSVVNGTDGCDDGNMVNGDGCDNNCKPTGCGNGVTAGAEQCDDANMMNGDGCDNNCTNTGCGNGIPTGTEACDDGNAVNGDGCDTNCTASGCGNAITAGTEACDDGNPVNGDGCDNNCTVSACGNGVAAGMEVCDDGNPIEGDGCDTNCTASACGNGIKAGAEACDDGNPINGDGCDTNCTVSACGNGVTAGAEACDDGNAINGDGCDTNCTVSACGNGIQAGAEACDDGDPDSGDGCSAACAVEAGYFCQGAAPSVCAMYEIVCNDGIDNNGAFGADAADPSCALPPYFTACGANQSLRVYPNLTPQAIPDNNVAGVTSSVSVSGAGQIARTTAIVGITHPYDADVDMFLTPPGGSAIDVCSDNGGSGANFTNTLLDPTCATAVTAGTAPFTGCYTPENAALITGLNNKGADGTWTLKVADDAGTDEGTFNGWALVLCTTVCGDGITAGAEQCDDMNPTNGDGCDTNCTTSACGNGIAGGAEQCDDGNAVNGDGCDTNCTTTACGNGILTVGEACDDNNTAAGDGCSPACGVEPGYVCSGQPSVCALPEIVCNDGIDNNGINGTDAADPSCALPAYFTACGANEALYVYQNLTAQPIPDSTPAGITSSVTVSGAGRIARTALGFSVTHAYDSDLDFFLTPPGGGEIDVNTDNGGTGDNFINTLLDPTCAALVTSGVAPFTGCYKPESDALVTALNNKDANGAWTLKIVDDASPDAGTLQGWTLALCTTICGNGVQSGAEQCDDNNVTDDDGCDSNCTTTACGNGVQTSGEACDDGNLVNGDGCDANCTLTACGNGVPTAGEACDDGDTSDGDGCSAACTVELGYTCNGAPSVCVASCGDGVINGTDQCDDANMMGGDGCSAACLVEPGYQCLSGGGAGSCSAHEQLCNDGADNDGDSLMDGADPDCVIPAYFPACGAGESLRVYRSVNVPKAIPDTDVTGVMSQVIVPDVGTIQRLAVLYTIPHTYDADLDISLVTPSNTTLDICSDNGLDGADFTNTVLDTTCATPIAGQGAASAPFSSCYQPETSFATFTGQPANGAYSLKAVDDAFGDEGTITDWALILCTN